MLVIFFYYYYIIIIIENVFLIIVLRSALYEHDLDNDYCFKLIVIIIKQ